MAGSFLLCQKSCPSCCWIREPIPERSEPRKHEPLVFSRMDLGSSPLQVSPLQLWEWGVDPNLSTGAGINPCHTQSCCPGSAKPQNLKLSASLTSPALSPSIPSFLFKETNTKGGKSASKFKDKLQTGQESQPIYYPSAASDAAFPPPETTVFFSLICLFSGIFRCQCNHSFPVRTAALKHLSVCSVLSAAQNTAIKNCSRLNLGILSVITEVIAFL